MMIGSVSQPWTVPASRSCAAAAPLCGVTNLNSSPCRAPREPPQGVVVPHRVMHGRPIVPEGDRALGAFETALELGRLGVIEQHLQEGLALVLAQLLDAGGEAAVDVERAAPGLGMGAH